MSNKAISLPRYIALRYVSVGRRSQLVSFMSAMSIFGLALSISILITVLSVMNGFDREMRENVLGIVPHLTINSSDNLANNEWDSLDQIVSENPQVVATAPVIEASGILASQAGNKAVLVNGIDAEQESRISIINKFVRQGQFENLLNNKWSVVIGETLANNLQVSVGDKVDLFSPEVSINPLSPQAVFRSFTVAAIYRVGTSELDSELLIANIDAIRALYRMRSNQTGLRIKLQDVLAADEFRLHLLNQIPARFSISSWTSILGNIYQNIQFSRTIISLMLWLLIAVAAFNLVVSLIMIVRDKRGDIAILRTLGASPRTIGQIFMWQGCMIGLIGTFIGVVVGILLSWKISDFASFIERRFSINLLNADVYPIDFLPSQLSFMDVLLVSIGVLLLALMATIYPARRAAAVMPAEALRTE